MKQKTHTHHLTAAWGMLSVGLLAVLGGARVLYELEGPFTSDSPIYWAMGRGILQGLVPYRDLFETKPPGIFLISSLSLWADGTMRTAAMLQAIALAMLPLLIIAAVVTTMAKRVTPQALFVSVCASLLLLLYTAERAGEFQVESFGAMFACMFLYGIARAKTRQDTLAQIFMIIGAIGAIGMKEPFVLSLVSVALVCVPWSFGMKALTRTLLVTTLVGLGGLFALGWLEAYVGIYLKEMFGNHIHWGEPIWLRVAHADRLATDVWEYAPALALLLAGLWGLAVVGEFRAVSDAKARILLLLRHIVALAFASAAVGIGAAYYGHHFVFAVPLYAAIVCQGVLFLDSAPKRVRGTLLGGLFVLSMCAVPNMAREDYAWRMEGFSAIRTDAERQAEAIDRILDACATERYAFLGANGAQPYGFTKHIPLGPIFFQYDYFVNGERPAFEEQVEDMLKQASILVMQREPPPDISPKIASILEKRYSYQKPPCAENLPGPEAYDILFVMSQ